MNTTLTRSPKQDKIGAYRSSQRSAQVPKTPVKRAAKDTLKQHSAHTKGHQNTGTDQRKKRPNTLMHSEACYFTP